jgi:hypothetical protein
MAKVMEHRIEKLSTLLDANEISLQRENNALNEENDNNSSPSTIKVKS